MAEKSNNKELYLALIAAREEMDPVVKDSNAYKWKYANLPSFLRVVIPTLKRHGLYLEQPTLVLEQIGLCMVTRIVHPTTGQHTQSVWPMTIADLKPNEIKEQQEGKYQTYHRRYQIMTLLGMCGEDDDNDGQALVPPKVVRAQPTLLEQLRTILSEYEDSQLKNILLQEKKTTLEALSPDRVKFWIEYLK